MTKPMPEALTEAFRRLFQVLNEENAALRAHDLGAAARLLPGKQAAITALEKLELAGDKATLRQRLHELNQLVEENRDLLRQGIALQSQVIGIVAGAARHASASGYGSSGHSTLRSGAWTLSARA
jgi:hypothetical protein